MLVTGPSIASALLAAGILQTTAAVAIAQPLSVTNLGHDIHRRTFNSPQKFVELYPVSLNTSSGYEGRDHPEYGLRSEESFYWGLASNPLAKLTANVASDNVRVLSLERFQNVIKAAKCTNTSVEFTFASHDDFDTVRQQWAWINAADDNYVVLVTENAKCNMPDGDNTQRQPWHVTKAEFDDVTSAVTLEATAKSWEDAFSQWGLHLSSKSLLPPNPPNPLSPLTGPHTEHKTFAVDVGFKLPSEPLKLVDDSDLSVSIECDHCRTNGTMDFNVDIRYTSVPSFSLDGNVTITPKNVTAMFNPVLSISAGVTHQLKRTLPILHADLAPFDIPRLFNWGPFFELDLDATINSVSAAVDVSLPGVQMMIPADATTFIDFNHSSKNSWKNWTPKLEPQLPKQDFHASESVKAFVGLEWQLGAELTVLGRGLAAGLAIDAPTIDAILTAREDVDGGICNQTDAVTGLDMSLALTADLDFFGGIGEESSLKQTQLASYGHTFLSTCLVVSTEAALMSSSSTTTSPAAPATNSPIPGGTTVTTKTRAPHTNATAHGPRPTNPSSQPTRSTPTVPPTTFSPTTNVVPEGWTSAGESTQPATCGTPNPSKPLTITTVISYTATITVQPAADSSTMW